MAAGSSLGHEHDSFAFRSRYGFPNHPGWPSYRDHRGHGRRRDTLDQFYRDHARAVFGYLVSLCRDPVWAEDLMQDTFVRATRAMAGYQGGSPRAWLFAIARTTFLDEYRKRSRRPTETITDVPIGDPDIAERQTIEAVLASLPETQRSALVLRDQLGLSYEEVAQTLGKSLAATKVIIHRARAAFRRTYQQET